MTRNREIGIGQRDEHIADGDRVTAPPASLPDVTGEDSDGTSARSS
jgi:hypothetical protein